MKNSLFSIFCLLALWSCHSPKADTPDLAAAAGIPYQVKGLSQAELQRYRDTATQILDKHLLRGSFNGAILLAKDGNIVYENYVGLKDPRIKGTDSITAETPFQIASTGKTMTAAAVLKLWEDEKLDLNDDLTKFFPGFPYPGVTVKTLLNHRSDLPN